MALGLLTSARRDAAAWQRSFVAGFAPQAATLAGFAFFATGLAKLNRDFASPATSCAAVFYDAQRTIPPYAWILPDADWAHRAAIVLTQLSETLGGLLVLAHHRTRKAGVLVAFAFLLLVGTNPMGRLYEFTSPFLAMMTLPLTWEGVPELPRPRWLGALLGTALFAAVLAGVAADPPSPWLHLRHTAGAVVFGACALVGLGTIAAYGRARPLGASAAWPGALAWLPVAVLLVHETLPYQGLRTERNLTMAGNFLVNTEVSNHWLVRAVPRLPWNHLAVLETSSDPMLNRRGRGAWVDWKLFDYLADHPDVAVTFTLDGATTTLARAGDDPRARHTWLAHHTPVLPTTTRTAPADCAGKRRP